MVATGKKKSEEDEKNSKKLDDVGSKDYKEYHFSTFINCRETFELVQQLTKIAIKE